MERSRKTGGWVGPVSALFGHDYMTYERAMFCYLLATEL